jgi:hypothetical protein
MDLRNEILKEHSRKQCDTIVQWIGNNQNKFDLLFDLFIGNEYKIVQRAAWPISYCVEAHPHLINKHFAELIAQLQDINVHDAVKRNTMRLLQHVTIPDEHKGVVMNCAFDFIQNYNEKAAVKAFSLIVLGKLALEYPDIIPEVKTIIEERLQNETPAFKSCAKQFLKMTKKISKPYFNEKSI